MYYKLILALFCSVSLSCIFGSEDGNINEVRHKKVVAMFTATNPGIDARIALDGNKTGIQLLICKKPPFADEKNESINIDFLSGVKIPITDLLIEGFLISDLQGLRNFKLISLSAKTAETTVLDISPLRDMPLKRLTLINPQTLKNYEILAMLPLEMLALRIKEFPETLQTVIGKLSLKDLRIEKADIANLDFIRKMPVECLYLNKTAVRSLTPIRNMTLKNLAIYNSQISDLTPLRTLPLENLTIVNCPVKDLSPLANCPLKKVTLENIPIGIKELAVLFDKKLFAYDISISGWNVDGPWDKQ